MKYCPRCGAKNEDNALFCTNCGASLEGNADVSIKAEPVKTRFQAVMNRANQEA